MQTTQNVAYFVQKTQVIITYLKGKWLNCCAKKRCEIFKGEKINLLLSSKNRKKRVLSLLKNFKYEQNYIVLLKLTAKFVL